MFIYLSVSKKNMECFKNWKSIDWLPIELKCDIESICTMHMKAHTRTHAHTPTPVAPQSSPAKNNTNRKENKNDYQISNNKY